MSKIIYYTRLLYIWSHMKYSLRRFTPFLLFFLMLFSLLQTSNVRVAYAQEDPIDGGITDPRAKVNATYARGDSWEVSAKEGYWIWSSQPRWVYNESRFVPYIFEDHYVTDGYYQVQSGLIGARIYDTYATYYDPYMQEVKVYNEIWEVQKLKSGKWDNIGIVSGVLTWHIRLVEGTVNITKTYDTWAGVLKIVYSFEDGEPLKHTITWLSELTTVETYRVVQSWSGIAAAKIKSETEEATDNTIIDAPYFEFLYADGSLCVKENQYSAEKYLQPTSFEFVTGNQIKCDFIFSNWTLSNGQSLEIDPATSTDNNPYRDGRVDYDSDGGGAAGYTGNYGANYTQHGEDTAFAQERQASYFQWDISSLPNKIDVTQTNVTFDLSQDEDDTDFYQLENDVDTTLAEIWADIHNGTEYVSSWNWAGTGNNKVVNLGASADSDIESYVTGLDKFGVGLIPDSYVDGQVNRIKTEEDAAAVPKPTLTVVYTDLNNAPTITSASITDMDDTDNIYSMRKYYAFLAVVNDSDGATDLAKVCLRAKNGAAVLWEVNATSLDGTPSYSISSGDTIIDLDTGNCAWSESGGEGNATFKIRTEWDHTQYNDLELAVYVEDIEAASAGWTDKQTNYFDVVNRLVTESLAVNDSRTNIGGTILVSGNVRYANTTSGDTASSLYPPDAQFTSVDIHDSSHSQQGTDATIVNGAFSTTVTLPSSVQSNTYHVYLNMAGDYTDADAPDGDTASSIGDRIVVYYEAFNDSRVNINAVIEGRYKAVLDHDDHALGSGDQLNNSLGATSWDVGNSWFEVTNTSASVGGFTIDSWTGSEATYGITSLTENITETEWIWDRIVITSVTASERSLPTGQPSELRVTGVLDYDDHALGSGDSLNISTVSLSWDATDSRFEGNITKSTPQTVDYDTFTSGSEATYGITAGTMNGTSVSITWYDTAGGGSGGGGGGTVAPSPPFSPIGEIVPEIPIPWLQSKGAFVIAVVLIGVIAYSQFKPPSEAKLKKDLYNRVLRLKKDVWDE